MSKLKLKLLSLGIIVLSLFLFSFLITTPVLADTTDAEVTLDLAPILGISATDVAIEINPNVEKSYDFTTGVSTVTVSTNNLTGYTLSIEGKDGSTVLHNAESNTDITSITDTNISSTSFSPNSWGYTLTTGSSATYNPIPTVTSEIKRTMSTVQSDETSVQFGVSVLPTIASGRYQGTVTFTALANFVPETEGKEILTVAPTTIEPTGGEIVAATNIDYSEAMGEITGSISNGENTINCQKSSDDTSTTLDFSETANNKLQVSCYIPETDKIGENYTLTISLVKFKESYASTEKIIIEKSILEIYNMGNPNNIHVTQRQTNGAMPYIDSSGYYVIPKTSSGTWCGTQMASVEQYDWSRYNTLHITASVNGTWSSLGFNISSGDSSNIPSGYYNPDFGTIYYSSSYPKGSQTASFDISSVTEVGYFTFSTTSYSGAVTIAKIWAE